MTKKQAIVQLISILEYTRDQIEYDPDGICKKYEEALELAIKALREEK